MHKNKILALVVLALMAWGLVACGSLTVTNDFSSDSSQTEETKPAAPAKNTVTDKDVSVTVEFPEQTIEIDGYYTGDVKNGKPEGHGTFAYWDNDDIYSMEYVGEFSDGTFNGSGKETEKDSENGIIRVYEGQFKNGNYNGYGVLTITDTKENYTLNMTGTFIKGVYTPTPSEAFDYIGGLNYFGEFKLSDEQAAYIDSHEELFPICDKATADATDLVNFTYKHSQKPESRKNLDLSN